MSGFRKPVTVYRKSGGALVKGRWGGDIETPMVIQASVQPLKPMEMESLPEGRRSSSAIKVYTDTLLIRGEQEREGKPCASPDILEWLGRRYEVVDVMPYQMGVIPHYKALAVEVSE